MAVSKSKGDIVSLLGGSVLDYAQITSSVQITGTTEGSPTTIVTGNAVIYNGSTDIIIEFVGNSERSTTGTNSFYLFEDGVTLGYIAIHTSPAAATSRTPVTGSVKRTPSAGSHTYSIRAAISGGGTNYALAGTSTTGDYPPSYIRIIRSSSAIGDGGIAGIQNGYAPLNSSLLIPNTYLRAPGYEYDYAEVTSGVTISGTTEGSPTTVVTGNAVTYDGSTIVMLEFFANYAVSPSSGGLQNIRIAFYEDGTSIGQMTLQTTDPNSAQRIPLGTFKRRRTPSAGSHTYSVRAFVDSGTGQVVAGAGGSGNFLPAYIRITKV